MRDRVLEAVVAHLETGMLEAVVAHLAQFENGAASAAVFVHREQVTPQMEHRPAIVPNA